MNSSTTIFNSRRYVCWALGLGGGIIAFLAGVNYTIDPYGSFGNNRLGVFISAEREAKPVLARRYSHNALIVGDSKAAMIPASEVAGFQFFNVAVAGASLEEIYYSLEHFGTNQQLVVLEADYLQCDPAVNRGDIFAPMTVPAAFKLLFSTKTVEYSVRTITEHLKGTPASIHPDGSSDATEWTKLYDRNDPAARQWIVNRLVGELEQQPSFQMSYYSKIEQLMKKRGIFCVVFVPPLEEEIAARLNSEAQQKFFNRWMDELRRIFPCVIDLSRQPYGAADNFFRADPFHFKPQIGARLMNENVVPAARQAMAKSVSTTAK